MTLWSVYHTLFGVIATFTVSYITPMVWYPHFIFYSVGKQKIPGETYFTMTCRTYIFNALGICVWGNMHP